MSVPVGHSKQREQLVQSLRQKRLASSLLFVGPSGIGKKRVAQEFLQKSLCEKNEFASCGSCASCVGLDNWQHPNVLFITTEGRQIKVDAVKGINQFISLKAFGSLRFIVIDQAHLLNAQASNALLKSLEEPPAGTHFILIASSLMSLLATIRSRCQIFRFSPLSADELAQARPEEPVWMIKSAQGSFERLEQLTSIGELREKAFSVWEKLIEGHFSEANKEVLALAKSGLADSLATAQLWEQVFRDAYLFKKGNADYFHQDYKRLIEALANLPDKLILNTLDEIFNLELGFNRNWDKGLAFQNFLLKFENFDQLREAY